MSFRAVYYYYFRIKRRLLEVALASLWYDIALVHKEHFERARHLRHISEEAFQSRKGQIFRRYH